jgi:hypothetical protein
MISLKALRHAGYMFFLATSAASAQDPIQQYESPIERVAVVELFTSHGCSSCPPADAWLRRLEDEPKLWQQVIPLAFHVDYWNYLGWQDRFADAAYSQRQRDYRRQGALSSVYTPGMLVNGREWRGWYWGRSVPTGESAQVGRLELEIDPGKKAVVRFSPGPDWQGGELKAHLAVLANEVTSHIGAGENRGRALQESFVVLAHTDRAKQVAGTTWSFELPAVEPVEAGRQAVVAWLSGPKDPTPLQAVGGWLAPPRQ